MRHAGRFISSFSFGLILLGGTPWAVGAFFFSTGSPNGLMALGSRPDAPGKVGIEAADDFALTTATSIDQVSFTGLMTGGTIGEVGVEIYRVFPQDSSDPPSGHVPTRANSPSDVAFAQRSASAGDFSFSTTDQGTFTAANSVLDGIFPSPNTHTGGEGPVAGREVTFSLALSKPLDLAADHYFFVPQVAVSGGEFYWLSSSKPIVAPGTPFTPDLQAWIRNDLLAPDWLRAGTDIVGGGAAYNGSFSLEGVSAPAPEPATAGLLMLGLAGLAVVRRRRS
jgi:hypothetical protein